MKAMFVPEPLPNALVSPYAVSSWAGVQPHVKVGEHGGRTLSDKRTMHLGLPTTCGQTVRVRLCGIPPGTLGGCEPPQPTSIAAAALMLSALQRSARVLIPVSALLIPLTRIVALKYSKGSRQHGYPGGTIGVHWDHRPAR